MSSVIRKSSTDISCCFFFSSRRRHTRSTRDWSSDVCSSDLRNRQKSLGNGPGYLRDSGGVGRLGSRAEEKSGLGQLDNGMDERKRGVRQGTTRTSVPDHA